MITNHTQRWNCARCSHSGGTEMTGTTWVEESGFLEGPVMITNTHSVGTVRDAVIAFRAFSETVVEQPFNPGRSRL